MQFLEYKDKISRGITLIPVLRTSSKPMRTANRKRRQATSSASKTTPLSTTSPSKPLYTTSLERKNLIA
jgi:hypothetical protein